MPFRLSCKNIFLTYPQCPLPKERVLAHLQSLLDCEYIKVCQERHEDGALHLHAILLCSTKKNIRNERFFDLDGFHPNVQAVKDVQSSLKYLDKEDPDPLSFGTPPPVKRKWGEVLEATSSEQALALVAEISPRDYVLSHDRVLSFVAKRFKPTVAPYVPPFSFPVVPPVVQQWLDQRSVRRPLSLILWGPSRTGKTELARSFGRHMYFNGAFNVDDWDADAEYAVFDDWEDWTKFWQYKQWIGAQQRFAVTDKYRAKRTVDWGKPVIIVSNSDPVFSDMCWLSANTMKLHVINKLF